MARARKQKLEIVGAGGGPCQAAKIGVVLLDLHEALREVSRCRQTLKSVGFSQKRWQEIVNDVDPELRFAVRPKTLDAIIGYLYRVGEPVKRTDLIDELMSRGDGHLGRIRQSIAASLRNGILIKYARGKVGLPEWKEGNEAQ
jgi:hypothetical protein